MIPLATAVECTRTILFEGESELDPPYWLSGTCFVCWYRGEGFVVSAAHALAHGERSAQKLRVHADPNLKDLSLPFDRRIPVSPATAEKVELADVELLHIATERCTEEQLRFVRHVDLETLRPAGGDCPHRPGMRFIIPGYPFDKKEIRYDELMIAAQRVVHGGTLVMMGERVHTVALDMPDAHDSLNGMSGAPVFSLAYAQVRPPDLAVEICPTFDGLVITGTHAGTSRARFVCSSVVFSILDEAVSGIQAARR